MHIKKIYNSADISDFPIFMTFDLPGNDLNDLEKIEPYDFLLDRPLELLNQQSDILSSGVCEISTSQNI